MNSELKENVITYWMEKATEALASARSEQYYERRLFAVNRAYYACFYAANAVLLKQAKPSHEGFTANRRGNLSHSVSHTGSVR
jgi:uncharacterized protein (UPF0332 family)